MAKNVKANQGLTHEEISARAHRIYEMAGRPEGKDMEHWLQAEAELNAERKPEATAAPAKPEAKPATAPQSRPGQPNTPGRNPNWQAPRQPVQHN